MIEFEVYSEKPDDKAIVARYWAMGEDGKFVEQVTDLLPYDNIGNSQQLIKYINEISSAWDKNQTCPKCEGYNPVRARSGVKTKFEVMRSICKLCQEIEEFERNRLKDAEEAELRKRLDGVTERNLATKIDFAAIPDDVALILIALNRAINPRLLADTFKRDECRGLAPAHSDKFIQQLWNAGVILDLPKNAALGAYFLKDGQVWHYNNKVAYFLVPDKSSDGGEAAFNALTMRGYNSFPALRQLWLNYALADCMAYLYDQCEIHRLGISNEDDAEIGSTLRTALEIYSVAQLWSVIWKIVRDAASLSSREYYNQAKAAATIPGKIKRHLEKAVKSNATIKNWTRPVDQPAGTLGDVLYEFFGIDEDTPGSTVMSMFSEPITEEGEFSDPPAEVIEEQVCTLMRRAIAHNLESAAIVFFAECIRDGANIKAALDSVFSAYPVLTE